MPPQALHAGDSNNGTITLLNIYYFRSFRINFLGGLQSYRRSDCIITVF